MNSFGASSWADIGGGMTEIHYRIVRACVSSQVVGVRYWKTRVRSLGNILHIL